MADLGQLGKVKVWEETSFGWFGATIRVRPGISDLTLMDFTEEANNLDENSPEVMVFLKTQVKAVLHEDDFAEFWRLAKEHGQDSEDLMLVMNKVIEAATARPTEQPSGSSVGLPATVTTLRDVSSSPDVSDYQETLDHTRSQLRQWSEAVNGPAEPEAEYLTRADIEQMDRMVGRPDLAGFVDMGARARKAATG